MKSKVNLELKYFCPDFHPIRSLLKSMDAKKIAVKKQKDYFFRLPKEQTSKVPARLKLRQENGTETLVFYRRPNFSDKAATNADIVLLSVKDKNLLPFLLHALGMKVVVEKTRELWRKGNIVFHLDIVKGVGGIFEIEVWAKPNTLAQDKIKFARYRKKFLPHLSKVVRGSNENIVLEYKKSKYK